VRDEFIKTKAPLRAGWQGERHVYFLSGVGGFFEVGSQQNGGGFRVRPSARRAARRRQNFIREGARRASRRQMFLLQRVPGQREGSAVRD